MWRPALAGPTRVPLDRLHHSLVHETSTQYAGHRLADFGVRGLRVLIEVCLRREDDAAQAEAALRRLFVDERLLDRVRLFDRAEALERRDLRVRRLRHRRHAGADRAAADDHGARAALPEAAAELRTVQGEVVAQHVQERRRRIDVDRVGTAVDVE